MNGDSFTLSRQEFARSDRGRDVRHTPGAGLIKTPRLDVATISTPSKMHEFAISSSSSEFVFGLFSLLRSYPTEILRFGSLSGYTSFLNPMGPASLNVIIASFLSDIIFGYQIPSLVDE
jgi:hypothetical protein